MFLSIPFPKLVRFRCWRLEVSSNGSEFRITRSATEKICCRCWSAPGLNHNAERLWDRRP